jgi:hypothetical protein
MKIRVVARKKEEITPQQHHDAHEKGIASETHCREFFPFNLEFSHILLLIQSMAASRLDCPLSGFLWPVSA